MSWTSSSGKLTRWSTFSNTLTPQRYVFAYPWDESPQRPAVPPRFPRPSPRTLVGLRLGSDLGSVIGRPALTLPGSPSAPSELRFYLPTLRRTEMRMIATSHTTSGERSMPDIGGNLRRIGASTGSVSWNASRETALVGYGLIQENTMRTRTTTRKAWSRKTSRLTMNAIRRPSAARTGPGPTEPWCCQRRRPLRSLRSYQLKG